MSGQGLLYTTALPLADELVIAAHLQALHDCTTAYRPLLGAPRQQLTTGSTLRKAAVQHLGEVRQAIARLDVRVPNLAGTLPDLVKAYEKAHMIVNAGHGPKPDATKEYGRSKKKPQLLMGRPGLFCLIMDC